MPGSESSLRAFARRYIIAFGLAAVTMIGAVAMVNYVFDEKFSKIERVNVDTVESPTEISNFLLIGSDTRDFVTDPDEEFAFEDPSDPGASAGQRSDTLMVIHVDPNKQRAMVVSFPRDLWVEVPGVPIDNTHCSAIATGKCMSKINSAFGNGTDTVIATLQQNFEIPINHYIEMDFKTFEGIVDAVGDVPIYFPYPTRDDDTGLFTPVAGCQLLDGKGALAYARARHLEYYSFPDNGWYEVDATADLARIKRQQDFMRRLMNLAVSKSLGNPLIANQVIDRIIPDLKIDSELQKDDLLGLIDVFSKVAPNSGQVEFVTLPARNGSAGSLSVLYVDETTVGSLLDVLRDNGGAPFVPSTTTTQPSVSSTLAATITTTTTTTPTTTQPAASDGSPATTTTTSPGLPTSNQERFGPPAANAAPCV